MHAEHLTFAPLIGDWAVAMSTRSPDGTVTSSDRVRADKRWFGGFYVRETLSGTFGGKPHDKLTMLGFNRTRERYEYVTADNHDAVILLYASRPDASGDGRRFDVFTEYLMPNERGAGARLVEVRTTLEIVDETRHELRNYYRPPGSDETLFLEYVYRRIDR